MMKKNIFILSILSLLGLGGVIATAQTAWNGTDWIGSQNTVSSEELRDNLDYLFNVKAPKPGDCHGEESFLGWTGGGWTCVQKNQPDSCIFNGNTISHGDSVVSYRDATVPFGESCLSESRSCTNGVLSGTYQSASCSAVTAGSCTFNGNTVTHGDSVTSYLASSVPFGESCLSESRSCTNGVLSGTYQSASCSVIAPSACAFGDSSIPNGGSTVAYESTTVPFGETCQSESRSCTNGQLSGSYESIGCSVAPAATCTFNGDLVQNGASVTAYATETGGSDTTCVSEQRTCTDGNLSGSYEHSSCLESTTTQCKVKFEYDIDGHDSTKETPYTMNDSVYRGSTSGAIVKTGKDDHCDNGCGLRTAVQCTDPGFAIRVGYEYEVRGRTSGMKYTSWSDTSTAYGAWAKVATSASHECNSSDGGCRLRMVVEDNDPNVTCSIKYFHRTDETTAWAEDGAWAKVTNAGSGDGENCESGGCGINVELYCQGVGEPIAPPTPIFNIPSFLNFAQIFG